MTIRVTCPICGADQQVNTTTGSNADYCSIACYRTGHGQPQLPLSHDTVTANCPVCHHPFTPDRRHTYCSDACRAAAYRRRRDANLTDRTTRPSRPPLTHT